MKLEPEIREALRRFKIAVKGIMAEPPNENQVEGARCAAACAATLEWVLGHPGLPIPDDDDVAHYLGVILAKGKS